MNINTGSIQEDINVYKISAETASIDGVEIKDPNPDPDPEPTQESENEEIEGEKSV